MNKKEADKHITFIRSKIKKEYKNHLIPAGSYRRGKTYISDLDILLIEPLEINGLLEILQKSKYITNIITKGSTRSTIIANEIQIDFMAITMKQLPFALLYFTGSKRFNIIMRGIAKEKGFLLNEYGIKGSDGKEYKAKTERDIFKIIGMRYHSPSERDK
jgi:DNA polymerase (family 10)